MRDPVCVHRWLATLVILALAAAAALGCIGAAEDADGFGVPSPVAADNPPGDDGGRGGLDDDAGHGQPASDAGSSDGAHGAGGDVDAGAGADAGDASTGAPVDAGGDADQLEVEADATGIQHLAWGGVDLFAGVGGYYIIGSCSGADDANQNVTSQGSDGHTLFAPGSCPGAPFSLTVTGTNPLHVSITVGPLPVAYRTLSVPLDPVKVFIEELAFAGDGYEVGCGTSFAPRAGSRARYDTIPLPCTIPGVGGVGVARVRPPPAYGEITGPVATVRRTFLSGDGRELAFINHPGTNNIELGFHGDFTTTIPAGTVVRLEEEILVSGPGTQWADRREWSFEAESALGHEVGRVDGDGWSADTNADGTGMLSYGPYAADVPAGAAHAVFRFLIDNASADSLVVLHLDVADFDDSGRVLASRDVRRNEFSAPFSYQEFALAFTSPGVGHRLELRTRWLDRAYVRQDRVQILRP